MSKHDITEDGSQGESRTGPWVLRLAAGQGVFYLVSGIWPLVSMRTFEAVTGPKTDRWLVNTVGLLIAVTGGTLLTSARRGRIPPETAMIGAGSAAALGTISLVYALRGRISRIYLLDAASELALVAAWGALWGVGARE